jgi:CxxC motif-containing protein
MEKRNLTCIGCPMGCLMTVEMDEGKVISVTGNTCKRGDDYARKEVTSPTRIVTSSVCVEGGNIPMVSVKTATDIPKDKIMDIMASIEDVRVTAPVHIGDVIVKNAANTGVDVIATKSIAAL